MTREEILEIVCNIYEEYEINEFGFDLFQLCKKMGINVIPYSSCDTNNSLLRVSEDGFCCFNAVNNMYEIFYNDKIIPYARIKFSIPHELGHIAENHPLNNEHSIYEERDANLFANELYVSQAFIIYYGFKTKTDLMSIFGITEGYAETLLSKVCQRKSLKLSQNEIKLIKILEKNRRKKANI